MFLLGSAYPTTKLGLNAEIPPILFGSLRMFLVFICLLPFCKFQKINKKYILPLIVFTLSMGTAVNLFLYLSVDASNIIITYCYYSTTIYSFGNFIKFNFYG